MLSVPTRLLGSENRNKVGGWLARLKSHEWLRLQFPDSQVDVTQPSALWPCMASVSTTTRPIPPPLPCIAPAGVWHIIGQGSPLRVSGRALTQGTGPCCCCSRLSSVFDWPALFNGSTGPGLIPRPCHPPDIDHRGQASASRSLSLVLLSPFHHTASQLSVTGCRPPTDFVGKV